MSKLTTDKWTWAWAEFEGVGKLPTSHLPDEIVCQDVAIHLSVGLFGDGEDRSAELSIGYLVGDGDGPNRVLNEQEREYLSAVLRHVADMIETEPHKVEFQEG